ncbi:MAG: nucleotidyltransferase [Isosphaeraceae bacterium]
MKTIPIEIDPRQIAEFCRRHHIAWLSLFGSALRPDFSPESDVDVLVEFQPDHTPGWEFFDMQEELSKIIGRRVDLNTPGFLSRYFRDEVKAGALPIYESSRD